MTGKHANNWDNRYDQERYFYGTEPNHLVARVLPGLPQPVRSGKLPGLQPSRKSLGRAFTPGLAAWAR